MFAVSLKIILLLYFLFSLGFVLFAAFNVYHALRFGVASVVNITTLVIFLAGAVFIFALTAPVIMRTNWNQVILSVGYDSSYPSPAP